MINRLVFTSGIYRRRFLSQGLALEDDRASLVESPCAEFTCDALLETLRNIRPLVLVNTSNQKTSLHV